MSKSKRRGVPEVVVPVEDGAVEMLMPRASGKSLPMAAVPSLLELVKEDPVSPRVEVRIVVDGDGVRTVGYRASEVRVQQLTVGQRERLEALRHVLAAEGEMVGARVVASTSDAVKWLLERIEVRVGKGEKSHADR